jgi:hypothetical protein
MMQYNEFHQSCQLEIVQFFCNMCRLLAESQIGNCGFGLDVLKTNFDVTVLSTSLYSLGPSRQAFGMTDYQE